MGNQIRQNKTIGVRKKMADIMFCIDYSYSMHHCIVGVRDTVNDFVSTLEAGIRGQMPVDWRIGLMAYTGEEFKFVDLAEDTVKFKKILNTSADGGDEFTPGAIDYTISNTNWREGAQRVIVVFTDESLETGKGGADEFDNLLKKIVDSHIQIIYYGEKCPYYAKFEQCPKAEVNVVSNFSGISFSELMNRLAVTVSSGNAFSGKDPVVKKMVYSMSDIKIRK